MKLKIIIGFQNKKRKYLKGNFGISEGPEYTSEDYKDRGQYIPVKINLNKLEEFNVVPTTIKKMLVNDIKIDGTLINIKKTEIDI